MALTVSTAVLYDSEPHVERPPVADPVAGSTHLAVPNGTAITMVQAGGSSTLQLSSPANMSSVRGSQSQLIEPDASPWLNGNAKHKHRRNRFQSRQRFGRAFDQIVDAHKQLS